VTQGAGGAVEIIHGDNLASPCRCRTPLPAHLPRSSVQHRRTRTRIDGVEPRAGDRATKSGFRGTSYARLATARALRRPLRRLREFLEPRLREAWRLLADDGTLYVHLDYREAHYAKVLLDALFGRECFLNELIWAYDYGAKRSAAGPRSTTRSWST
jgi:site-specific DNA-methyltransferase (adenine-specific)